MDAVIGNSSSGLIEAPSFKVPTINIGDRQRGRIMADTVISCPAEKSKIVNAINKIQTKEFKDKLVVSTNPYGTENVSQKIVNILKKTSLKNLIKKKFHDL